MTAYSWIFSFIQLNELIFVFFSYSSFPLYLWFKIKTYPFFSFNFFVDPTLQKCCIFFQ